MKIIVLWICVSMISLLAIGYVTIKEILVSFFCAVLLIFGTARVCLWYTGRLGDRSLVEGAACIIAVFLILYWVSSYPEKNSKDVLPESEAFGSDPTI